MEDKIIGYLQLNEKIWVNYDHIYKDISLTNGFNDDDFERSIIQLVNDGIIRINLDDMKQTITVALEEKIKNHITSIKKSALDEMEDELKKAIQDENYEKAAEYRDMINETKSKL